MIAEPRCSERRCIHLIGVSDAPEDQQVPICVAFMKGIPAAIAYGDNLHLKPYPGDGGITYEEDTRTEREIAGLPDLGKAFDPNQPRWPEGDPRGGQWKDDGVLEAERKKDESDKGLTAEELFDKYNDPNATEDTVLADPLIKVPPEHARMAMLMADQNLKRFATTDALTEHGGFREIDDTTEGGTVWTREREAIHERIIKKILSPEAIANATPKEGEKPQLILFGGRGGSGKSWLSNTERGGPYSGEGFLKLDSDEIKGMLPGYAGWNAGLYHEESSHIFERITDIARRRGLNIIQDATLKTESSAMARLNTFVDSGYEVSAAYMFSPRQESARNSVNRFFGKWTMEDANHDGRPDSLPTGRYVPPSYVLGSKTNEKTFGALTRTGKLKEWKVYSSQGNRFPPIFISGGP